MTYERRDTNCKGQRELWNLWCIPQIPAPGLALNSSADFQSAVSQVWNLRAARAQERTGTVERQQQSERLQIENLRYSRLQICATRHAARAFSLVEILITMGLLSFIVLGLLAMFNQTQRAFRAGMTQSDVLEAGRSTMDLLARELEQMTPSHRPYIPLGNNSFFRTTNFFVELDPFFDDPPRTAPPLVQELPPGNGLLRTNIIQRFFFLTRQNQDWVGTGYQVWPDDANGCVGALYRYSATNYPRSGALNQSGAFQVGASFNVPPTNFNRIADGVVHLRLRAFDDLGRLLTNGFPRFNYPHQTLVYSNAFDADQSACYSFSNAVPGFVELELGILEPQILQRYRAIGVANAQRDYLSNHVAQVHIFRQRIPVRNVDFKAYTQ